MNSLTKQYLMKKLYYGLNLRLHDEQHIQRAVESAKLLTHNILLVDIGSIDKTAEIAKKAGAQVFSMKDAPYVELVRMKGIEQVKTDWVFILDSDEL